ncbi:MAG: formylmethanofuran--tetrahydromethanopterin N-formyltransferase [Methanosphaera sp.]|uniref:formylmethanofuran--tetrahydromethanopterin N-formyltransferase n=1 Tax=Methanosphaera sp. TaxID=2666342 RepID=UPI0025D71D74|nr:formylmethanofuran--tetrahydromethanopterin N-formyltransferase [Methanosphaera sp.]MCI5866807.1 formylmethanofuran--tetrahydromethanopterin N-formyltransferase [Methanosphaera sp.]MDD6534321.1 formylmethanofuran--tetrahydromethanopterin N-formyltransferase [Methanosphaera sp.]MDY3956294.1 formylmethanofuran--tetrahydromethanopterin N-formyltransferase [Methanosphaera sp.]
MTKTIVDDTYAEAFSTKAAHLLITAQTKELAHIAAVEATGYATSFIGCSAEAGIDRFMSEDETPDNRPGYSIIICQNKTKQLEDELLNRIGQCVLTAPTTAVFNLIDDSDKTTNLGFKLSFFADGYQSKDELYNKDIYRIPVMSGDFIIEESFGIVEAVAGGNLFIMAKTQDAALRAAQKAVEAIGNVEGTITPFPGGIVASGSKVGSNKYDFMDATTNEKYCPTLKDKVETQLPDDVEGVYEIVFDALTFDAIKQATSDAIDAIMEVEDVVKISAGNYGGNLGKYKINLIDE